jgi:hypothetical protein
MTFRFGASFEFYHDDDVFAATLENGDVVATAGFWVGAAYELEPWTFGIGYSILQADIDLAGAPDEDFTQQRAALTASYELGSGIDLDGELAYTWTDADPESAPDFAGFADYERLRDRHRHRDRVLSGMATVSAWHPGPRA